MTNKYNMTERLVLIEQTVVDGEVQVPVARCYISTEDGAEGVEAQFRGFIDGFIHRVWKLVGKPVDYQDFKGRFDLEVSKIHDIDAFLHSKDPSICSLLIGTLGVGSELYYKYVVSFVRI